MATPIPDNEASFDADELSAAVGPRVRGEGRAVRGVVLDSRRVGPGNVFVALRGEQHDAHRFVESAVASGAAAVIVDREIGPLDVDVYRVPDTLAALGALGALHRARSRAEVIAVTGSVGKTTTKELIAAALRGMGRTVLATAGNLNNRIGVPMTLLSITDAHDAAVIEIGMSIPGEIADLARMTAPHVGVVTAVAEVHTEGVGGL
ncbi:MAG: Mur ligase family protein, partial [Sandaracinaceae bacterium]